MKTKKLIFILLFSQSAMAEDFKNFLDETTFSGDLRAYDFNRDYGKENNPSQQAFSLGGALNILSGPIFLEGLRVGGSFYTAQPLGLNSNNPKHVDNTLPGYSVNVLGQDFLEYENKNYLLRAGNQEIKTPWLNDSDSRMIPATYEGIYGKIKVLDDLELFALRTFKFKSRTSKDFNSSNLYNTENIGGSGIPAFGNTSDNGAAAIGASLKKNNFSVEAWGYQFLNFSNLIYANTRYDFSKQNFYIGLQGLREWGDGNNALAAYAGGKANADALGVILGTNFDALNFSTAYNDIPTHDENFKQGNILSPYTSGYATDPLYTTSMIAGLVEKSSGQAIKFSSTYTSPEKSWQLSGSFAKYFTAPRFFNTNEIDGDITYHFSEKLKGLSARNRLGILNGNKATGRFVYNRVMLEYDF